MSNGKILGSTNAPTPDGSSGFWSLNTIRNALFDDQWPDLDPKYGAAYAASYLATTGGTLHHISPSDDLTNTMANAARGDAILLDKGLYQCGMPSGGTTFHGGKEVLVVGNTAFPQLVVIEFDSDNPSNVRDHPIFENSPSTYTQLAFLTFWRNPTTDFGTNYANAILRGSNNACKAIAVNVYFDLDDYLVSWIYDNNSRTTHDLRIYRSTFANYSTWMSKYSGQSNVIDVGNCLFDDTTITTEFVNLGGNIYSAVVDTTDRKYDEETYPTAGHLYVPNTNAIF